jgi:hypothetical protein
MEKMPWLDTLSEPQIQLASKIIAKAKEEGVDPKFALSLAFRESSLNHGGLQKDKDGNMTFKPLTGTSGEIGVMQVMPGTAKQYGYKPEDLQDLDKNVEIGLKILKSHIGKFNDPMLAAAAYNAGPGHPFFTDPAKNSLPDSTKQYIKDIAGFGGFGSIPTEQPAVQEAPENRGIPLGGGDQGAPTATEPDWKERLEEQIPRLAGAGAGAAVGTSLEAGNRMRQGAGLIGDFMRSQIAARQAPAMPGVAPAALPAGGLPTSQPIPSGGPDAGRMARGQTGTMPYNYGKAAGLTDIEAGRALDMTKQTGGVHDLTTQRREGLQRIQQLFPGESYVENPRFGGLMTPNQGVGSGPRQSFVTQGPTGEVPPGAPPGQPQGTLRALPARAPIPTTVPTPATSLLDDAIEMLGKIARGGLRFVSSAPVAGALGGYGAVSSAEEAYNRAQAGDKKGAMTAGAGGLGVLAALPHPLAKGVGLAAGAISPLALMALDRARQVRAQPPMPPATPEEMQQAQRPSFMTARP